MFQAFQPLVAERAVHLLISTTTDGRLSVYVEPIKTKDDENVAFVTPFRAQATAAELDEQLPAILTQWIASRQASNKTLAQQLADAEAAAKTAGDEAKKKAADKHKKPTVTTPPTKTVTKGEAKPVVPSLLDALDTPLSPVEVTAAASVATATVANTTTAIVEESVEVAPETASPKTEKPAVQPPVETVQAAPASVVAEATKTEPAAPATTAPTVSTEPSTPDLWG